MGQEWLGAATLVILIFVVIALIVGIIYYKLQNNGNPNGINNASGNVSERQQDIAVQLQYTKPQIQWGPNQAGPTPVRNTCQLYTFPATMLSNGLAVLGRPTYRSDTINLLAPLGPPGGCIDIDQLALQQFQRACIQDTCTDSFGNTYQKGDVSTFYGLCGTGSSPCNDVLGLIAFNFSNNINTNECLTMNTDINSPATVSSCSLTNNQQLLRVFRYQPSGKIDNSAGPYASIQQRSTGLFLTPVSPTAGSTLYLQVQNKVTNNGVIWWLFPFFSYNLNGQNIQVPAQLIYWTNITATPPASQQQIENFLRSNGPNMLAVTYNDQNQAVLAPMLLDYNNQDPTDQRFNAQLLSYDIYNILLTSNQALTGW